MRLLKIALILSSTVSTPELTSASEYGLSKRLYETERAPFAGTLFNEEALRAIDIEMTEKRLCENKLEKMSSSCDLMSEQWPTAVVAFVLGVAVGGIFVLKALR